MLNEKDLVEHPTYRETLRRCGFQRTELCSKKPKKIRKHYAHWDVDLEKIFAILKTGRMKRGAMDQLAQDCKIERRTLDAWKTKIKRPGYENWRPYRDENQHRRAFSPCEEQYLADYIRTHYLAKNLFMPPSFVNVLAKRLKYCIEVSGFPDTDDWATGPDLTEAGLPELPPDDAMDAIAVDEDADPVVYADDDADDDADMYAADEDADDEGDGGQDEDERDGDDDDSDEDDQDWENISFYEFKAGNRWRQRFLRAKSPQHPQASSQPSACDMSGKGGQIPADLP
jgi:hypothetical protein